MKLRFLVYLSFITISITDALAFQEITSVDLNFSHLSIDDGLSHNTITSIFQSRSKEIWIATRDGLNRYNGFDIKKFYKIPNDSNSINSNVINSLIEDHNGRLWIATNNGICRYDEYSDSFIRFPKLKGLDCTKVVLSQDGKIWVTTNEGLFFLENETNRFEKVNFYSTLDQYDVGSITNLFEIESGKFLIASEEGVFKFSEFNNSLVKIPLAEDTDIKIAIKCIYRKNSEILLGNKFNGIFSLDIAQEKWTINQWKSEIFQDIAVRSINEDDEHNLWIGTYNGIYIISENGHIGHVIPNKSNSFGLSYLSVTNIYKDRNQNMWIGTYFGGINLYNKRQNLFKNFWPSKNNFKLINDAIRGIETDSNGKLWVGTQGSGVVIFDFKKKTLIPIPIPVLQDKNIHFLALDKSQRMWVGTHKHGLFLCDLKTNHTRNIPLGINRTKDISRIHVSDNNTVYVTGSGNKLFIFKGESKTEIEIPNVSPNSLTTDIFPFENNLFLGHSSGGIIYDPVKNTFFNSFEGFRIDSLLRGKTVISFIKTKKGQIFIGTDGDGLFHLNLKDKKVDKYTIANGLINNTICDLIEDDLGNVWATSNQGLMMMREGNFSHTMTFDRSDGLPSLQFSYNSVYKDQNGVLYFGTINGLTYVDPNNIELDSSQLSVSIVDFKIGNIGYKYKALNNKFVYKNDQWIPIELKHNQNSFTINFESYGYGQEVKNRFAYRLLNQSKKWIQTNSRSVAFKDLPVGTYTFQVKSSNPDGSWSEEIQTLDISVNPPWWMTWQAFVSYLIAVFLFAYGAYNLISERIRIKKAVKLKEFEISQVKKINQIKLKFFTNISHEFRTPITLISGPINALMSLEEKDPKKNDLLQIAKRNCSRLLNLVDTLLNFRMAEQGFLKLSLQKLDFNDFLINNLQAFLQAAINKNILLNINTKSSYKNWVFDPNKMASVIYNLVGNAIKFTPAGGVIDVTLEDRSDSLYFEVKNTGIEIPSSKIDQIFDRFYSINENSSFDQGFGIGLSLTKEIVRLHKGIIKVLSSNGGTTFSVLLPRLDMINEESQIIEQHEYVGEKFLRNTDSEFIKIRGHKKALKVLVVDDNRDVLEYISSGLEKEYRLCLAENGKEALVDVHDFQPNLIISDVMMPELDGIGFCKEIKTNIGTSHIPFIMVTAKDTIPDELIGLESGADVYISKPFNLEALNIQIRNILQLINQRHREIEVNPSTANLESMMLTKLDQKFMDQIFNYIHEHIEDQQLGTEALAKAFGMSNSTFYRKIKAITNKGSNELIRSIRLKKAAELIGEKEYNISEIAYKTGFTSLSYFSACFKKEFDMLPKKYLTSLK